MLNPGDRIGDWIVESTLGAGGMGAVFRAHNALTPRIVAALKVMRPDDLTATRDRFLREIEALEGLHHPAIVRVKGWGEDAERKLLWMAMDVVEGNDLSKRIEAGPVPADEVERMVRDLASGLAHAHERGIFHRDIKPGNILLRQDGSACLVDFGIAVDASRTRLTQMGTVPGTPAYVAPEVFGGEPPDPRLGDIYALGQVAYESLLARSAFPERDDVSTTQRYAQLMGQKLRAEALDPGEGTPGGLRTFIQRATEPEPEDRLPRVADAITLLDGGVPAPPPPGLPTPLRAPETMAIDVAESAAKGRFPWVIAAVLALLTLVVGGAVVALVVVGGAGWLLLGGTPPPRDVAVSTDLPAGTPVTVRVAGMAPVSGTAGEPLTLLQVPPEPTTVEVVAGTCAHAGWDPAACPACCACTAAALLPDPHEIVVHLDVPELGRDVIVTAPELEAGAEGTARLGEAHGVRQGDGWRFASVAPGSHELEVAVGDCPAEARGCWPDCPEGCASQVRTVEVLCAADPLSVAAAVGMPARARPVVAPAKPAPVFAGLKIRVLYGAGKVKLGEKAARLLRARGASVELMKGQEGGMWEEFWGGAYYMRKDLDDETATATRMLHGLGYLEPRHTGESTEVDLVLWLR